MRIKIIFGGGVPLSVGVYTKYKGISSSTRIYKPIPIIPVHRYNAFDILKWFLKV